MSAPRTLSADAGRAGALNVRSMRAADWPAVRAAFEDGLATGHATLETAAPSWETWDEAHLTAGRLVAERPGAEHSDGDVVGWAALSPVSGRCVYGGVAEVSVYVAAAARGQGAGRALLGALVAASEAHGLWTLQAGILAENTPSARLHEAAGFRLVGHRERLGRLRGVWRDVLLYERRSNTVGID